ncbi:unnamed protein product [Rhizophagus irregularis]|uniref:Zinc finger protein 862-like n=1 Tax=Rhizophagus irregularis TaxID=588596 RepID=A0A915ZMX0_9GLOM|nr:unnamed protein product [Rhizophagus irregularis]CAB5382786.1 unnamed protein product [Rhizophagus irregularis]
MVSKHFSHNVPVLRYIGLIELEDYTADNILTQILEFIQNNGLNLDNLIHFGSDDASTMVGRKNGVAAKLKELNLFLTSVHCISHRLYLVGKDAANEVQYFKKYEATCKKLYSYFSRSYKRMLNLKIIQESNDDPQLAILNIINTQFKSLLDATIAMIKTQFIGFDDQPPIYGTNLQQFLQNNPFYNNHIPDDFVYFAKALVHSLQARFSHNDLYDSMKILDPKELPLQESALSSYGIEELKLLCKHFGNQKHKSNVPLSNANVERVFSQHKLTKTRLRNRLNVETLDMHLTILLNAPDNIEEFNWDKAFNQWKNEHVQ